LLKNQALKVTEKKRFKRQQVAKKQGTESNRKRRDLNDSKLLKTSNGNSLKT
jgi:hypothetical protein